MPAPVRTNLATILPLILARLQSVTGLPDERCFLSQQEEMPFDGMAPSYVWLRVEGAVPKLEIVEGAGRYHGRFEQTISVTVRTRLELDRKARDLVWLTDADGGHEPLVHAVYNALVTFWPADEQNNLYADAPLWPVKGDRPRKDQKQTAWGVSTLWFAFLYTLELDEPFK
jgi:hypothetical protein